MPQITDTDRIDALIRILQEDHEIRLHDGTLKSTGTLGLNVEFFGGDLRGAIDKALLDTGHKARPKPA